MKKTIFILTAILVAQLSFAQMSEKFIKAMETNIVRVDSASTVQDWVDITAAFERIAEAEKNQWLPYYYVALGHVMAGTMSVGDNIFGNNTDKTDPKADAAEKALNKAISLSKETSETWVLKKMIISLRMMGDVMNRAMTAMGEATAALDNAKKLDVNNPRIYILEAQDKYFTPEQYGGSKDEAKILFEKAQKLFETFKPESSIHPNWGRSSVDWFLKELKGGK
jgi:hypothetical protein